MVKGEEGVGWGTLTKDLKQNVDTAYNELLRQFEVQEGVLNRYNRTLEVMMGFTVAIVIYMITQQNFFEIAKFDNVFVVSLFFIGLSSIVISGCLSFSAYYLREYDIGPNVDEFLEKFSGFSSYNFKTSLLREIHISNERNKNMISRKGSIIRVSYALFGAGFLLILITITIYYLNWC